MNFRLFFIFFFSILISDFCFAITCNIEEFGAKGDGKTLNTQLIQRVFDDKNCTTIIVPDGKFLSGGLNITRSNVNLEIKGTLLASTNIIDYNVMPHIPSYPCDRDICSCCRYQPFLLLFNVTNFLLYGSGSIDGQGKIWWERFSNKNLTYGRPRLVETMYCNFVKVFNVTLKDSPFWTTHLFDSDNIEIGGAKVIAPADSHNTDGFDPDSSRNVYIHDCRVENGDDCIAVKSGMNEAGRDFNKPCVNVTLERLVCINGGGLSIGSEMSGGIENIYFRNCTVSSQRGVTIKTSLARGGYVKNILYEDIIFDKTDTIVELNTAFVNEMKDLGKLSFPFGVIDNITYINLSGNGNTAGSLICDYYIPCTNIRMQNVNLSSGKGFTCNNVTGSTQNVSPKICF